MELPAEWEHLRIASDLVQDLENQKNKPLNAVDCDNAQLKQKLFNDNLTVCLERLHDLKETCETENKGIFYYLLGKAYNFKDKYDKNAEEVLSKAVKFNPRFVDGWNELGECFWKKTDTDSAKICFKNALRYSENKVSLRNLSIILRQGKCEDVDQIAKNIEESVGKAEAAVNLDLKDGISWSILGNAYLFKFFNGQNDPQLLQKCMNAYLEAEKDPLANQCADLHYNKAMVFRYEEQYTKALDEFHRAINLDPQWEAPVKYHAALETYLKQIDLLVRNRGKLRLRKLEKMLKALTPSQLGPFQEGHCHSLKQCLKLKTFNELQEGTNGKVVILGIVVAQVFSEDHVPFTFCICDQQKQVICVTLYNLADGKGVVIGDSVAIPEPFLKHIRIALQDQNLEFPLVRVQNPLMLVVNGRRLGRDSVAYLQLSSHM